MPDSRRPDIDALRVFATYLLFAFHAGKVFDPAPFYHVRNADLSFGLLVACGFVSLWHMPLFFLLAGWSAASSLGARGTRGFVAERLRRLAIPLVTGVVLFGPVIKYLELRSGLDLNYAGLRVAPALQDGIRSIIPGGLPVAPPFDETFGTFLPTFFTHLDRFTWSHLWFVAYLLTFTLLYLPAFRWCLRRPDRFGGVGAWIVYSPVVPLVLIQLTLRRWWPGIYNLFDDWGNVAFYGVYLFAGVVLGSHPALEQHVHRQWKRALVVGTITTVLLLLAVLGVIHSDELLLAGAAVAGWCFVIAGLGIAKRLVASSSPTLAYLSESAFPVYVLHQAAIVVPGFVIVQWPLGIATKLVLLMLVSIALTMATYHWVVRPFRITRFAFGMRPLTCGLRRPLTTKPAVAVVLGLMLAARSSVAGTTPVGVWYAEGGAAQVAIAPCGPRLCGRVVWLRSPFDDEGCLLHDRYNPDPSLRERDVMGLEILDGLEGGPGGTWHGGRIYDPASGRSYTCTVALAGNDRLLLRGYIGIPLIGRTTTWIRVGAEARVCSEVVR